MNFNLSSPLTFVWCGSTYAKDPNWIHETRFCNNYELFYVTDGTLYLSADDTEHCVSAGEFLITPPCRQAGFKKSACNFFWFHFLFDDDSLPLPICHEALADFKLFDTFCSLLTPYNIRGNRGGHLMAALLTEISRCVFPEQTTTLHLSERIKDYVHCYSPSDLSCTAIATYFGYSSRYISTLFYKETGIHLKKYILDEIMRRAKYFLTNSNLSIENIALNLNYSDAQNFSHAFKNHEKISPGKYRRQMHQEIRKDPGSQ